MPARPLFAGLAAIAALLAPGCGTGGAAPPGSVTVAGHSGAPSAKTDPKTPPAAAPGPVPLCQSEVGSFVASMDSLRRRLAVGVTYEQYVDEIDGIRSTYRKIPVGRLEIGCLGAAGSPAEKAFNRYIEAADDWGECVSEAGCSSAAVEPVLQRRWRIASRFLSAAERGLRAEVG